VGLVLLGTVLLTYVACLVLPPRYSATTTLVLDSKPDPIASVMMQTGIVPTVNLSAATEAEIITSEGVARRVVSLLKLEQNETIKQEWMKATGGKGKLDVWLGALLLKKVTVKQVSLQSNVIPIKFESSDPEFAAAVANAFAQAYIEFCIQRKVEPAKQYAGWFEKQEHVMRESMQKAQAKLSRYQQQKGIVSKDEQLDDENAKLTQLTNQLAAVLGQTADAVSKEQTGVAADSLPEVATNPLITSLKTDLNRQEAKLKDLGVNLGKNHPAYRRVESEIAMIREQLQAETRFVTGGFTTSRNAGRNKEKELRIAIEEQKKKLLQIKIQREELAVLQRDVDAAKKAHDGIVNQLHQSNLDSQATLANVAVLTVAAPPLEPSFPKILLFTLLAIPAGLLIGAAAAYALDMHERPLRFPEDFAELQLPLLGVIAAPPPRGVPLPWPRRLAELVRR
jgi:polysaccharide biosynthesis transport protein